MATEGNVRLLREQLAKTIAPFLEEHPDDVQAAALIQLLGWILARQPKDKLQERIEFIIDGLKAFVKYYAPPSGCITEEQVIRRIMESTNCDRKRARQLMERFAAENPYAVVYGTPSNH
jgi:hypothetical protein